MAMAAAAFLLLLITVPSVYAKDHVVGGNSGWNTGENYNSWANGLSFAVDDKLVFNYGPTHTVDVVSKSAHDSCNAANAIQTFSTSPTTIPLNTTGTMYFICGTPGHCQQGMKLAVTVGGSGGNPPSSGSAPSGTPPSTTTPPSAPSGAAGVFANLIVVFSVLSAVTVALTS